MTQDPRLRRDASAATHPWNANSSAQPAISLPMGGRHDLTDVAKTLAAYGGQAVAFDLALDLVLNETVEQARAATGATGAAIALSRDGVMECRATTGKDAPDLGVKVETESGLSGACLRSGEVQHCSDTENDLRVDAEACRQLSVRSMLIVPLIDGTTRFGILEVFSSRPNAFSGHDVQTLQVLAQHIVESTREAERGSMGDPGSVEEDSHTAAVVTAEAPVLFPPPETRHAIVSVLEPEKETDLWTTVLVILVIAVAVVLGVLIGWRGAAKKWVSESRVRATPVAARSSVPAEQTPQPMSAKPGREIPPASANSVAPASPPDNTAPAPSGGLVVTQNGKVIYRESPNAPTPTVSTRGAEAMPSSRMIRRVEPEYPVAAANQHIQGPVVLDVQVLSDGTIGTVGIVSGDPALAEAAVHAVRQWKYQPNVVNGRPVEGQTRITINFTLPPTN